VASCFLILSQWWSEILLVLVVVVLGCFSDWPVMANLPPIAFFHSNPLPSPIEDDDDEEEED
jgi:hypothetical protein